MSNIDYYNQNSEEFINRTKDLDMSRLYDKFEQYTKKYGTLLDLGCGAGRDSYYFHMKGHQVTSLDASEEMIKYCKSYLETEVVFLSFEDYDPNKQFDAIWASASLLHVPREKLVSVIEKYVGHLKTGGLFYMSFKNYEDDFSTSDRHFTCFTPNSLKTFIGSLDNIQVLEIMETKSVKKESSKETWVSAIIRKVD